MTALPLLLFAAFFGYHPMATTYECHVTNSSLAVDTDMSTFAINRKQNAMSVCQASAWCPPGFTTRQDGACTLPSDDSVVISSYVMARSNAPCSEFLSLVAAISRPQSCTGSRCSTSSLTWVLGGNFTPGPNIFSPGTWQWELVDVAAVGRGELEEVGPIFLETDAQDGYDQVLLGRDFAQPTGAYQDSRWNLDLQCSL